MFHRAGIDISMIQRAVGPTKDVLVAARQTGIPVIYLKMAFKADLSDAGPLDSPNFMRHQFLGAGSAVQSPDGRASRILVRDTWNTDILSVLAPEPIDIVIYKHRFSGFFETELDACLKRMEAKYLIVTGCTTSICVESTIRDAMFITTHACSRDCTLTLGQVCAEQSRGCCYRFRFFLLDLAAKKFVVLSNTDGHPPIAVPGEFVHIPAKGVATLIGQSST